MKPSTIDPTRLLAFRAAREEVKLALRRKGYRVTEFPARQISEMAKTLFEAEGARLIAEAKAYVERHRR